MAARGRIDDILWGPYLEMRTGWSTDPELRFAGASGGALSGLLLHLLESGTVDAVVQIEADPDNPIANRTVISTDRAGILAAAGSRYAPSAPLARLMELVGSGRRHAFVGKPCDVVALRALADDGPRSRRRFRSCCRSSVPGSRPRPAGARFWTPWARSRAGHAVSLSGAGLARAGDGDASGWQRRAMSYHDSWGKILSKHVQHRCKICADGTGKAADIVCADAWECDEAGYPVFEEADGVSLIVSRTALGARLLEDAVAAGRIKTGPFDVAGLAAIQPGQRERRRALLARLSALRLAGQPVPRYTGLHLGRVALQNPVLRNLKNFLGMLRRVVRARLSRQG